MGWNYRIVQYESGGFGLHEVYYNDDGEPCTMTEEPCSFACDEDEGAQAIIESLQQALRDAERSPVLKEPKEWAPLKGEG